MPQGKRLDTTILHDPSSDLADIVGSSGHVVGEYGGYEITIGNPSKFPWKKVFGTLLSCSFDVWIEMREEKMTILSKPKSV